MSVSIRWHGDKVVQEITKEIEKRLDQAAQEVANHMREKVSAGRRGSVGTSGPQGDDPPHVDTGALRQSIFWTRNGKFVRQIGIPKETIYGLFLEIGGQISPKRGKFLAIPWSQEARNHSRGGGTAATFNVRGKPLRRVGRGTQTFLLVEDFKGKKARTVIHYIITSKTIVKTPRPWMRPSLDEMRGRVQEIFS